MALGSSPAYDATYALSHALRTVSEGGTKTKPVELTQAFGQMHAGAIAVPTPTSATSATSTTAVPLTYRVDGKGKGK